MSRRGLAVDVSGSLSHPFGCGTIELGNSLYGGCHLSASRTQTAVDYCCRACLLWPLASDLSLTCWNPKWVSSTSTGGWASADAGTDGFEAEANLGWQGNNRRQRGMEAGVHPLRRLLHSLLLQRCNRLAGELSVSHLQQQVPATLVSQHRSTTYLQRWL